MPTTETAATTTCTNCQGTGCRTCGGRGGWPSDEELAPGTLAEITGAPRKRRELKALVGEIVRVTALAYEDGAESPSFAIRVESEAAHKGETATLARQHLEPRLDNALETEARCFWPAKRLKQLTLAQALGHRSERSVGRVSRQGRDFRLKLSRVRSTENHVAVFLKPAGDKAFRVGAIVEDDLRLGRLVRQLAEKHLAGDTFFSIDYELL